MVSYSAIEGAALEARQNAKVKKPVASAESEPACSEVRAGGLVDQVKALCYNQWPRWKVLSARTDKKSGLPSGAHDMTIFASAGRIFCVELKAKGNKLDPDQVIWKHELELVGTTVHVIYSIEEFKNLVGL